jgi:hypothetical protein
MTNRAHVPAVRWRFVAALWIALLFGFASCESRAERPKIEPFVAYSHTSDILRGPPFWMHDPRYDPTIDYVAIGGTFSWQRVEVDLSHGVKALDRGKLESGTALTVRVYPWRK